MVYSRLLSVLLCEGLRAEQGGNLTNQLVGYHDASEPSRNKDMQFRRTSSYNDVEGSETLFIDMLKSTKKSPAAAAAESMGGGGAPELMDGAMRGSGKKKGKKGRQIDPALLGFKVTSNRIMMGEIQGIDD